MMRYTAFLLPVLLVLHACSSAEPADTSAAPEMRTGSSVATETDSDSDVGKDPTALDDIFATLDEQGFSGLVMVKQGDELNSIGFGFADRKAGLPFDEHTVFTVGSITKQFTAAAILKLEMEGRLSVEDRLGDHVPYATGELADVTLHELLTHTAGLPDGIGDDFEPVDRTEIVELSANAIENPGEQYRYSNPGYSMLGVVIEEITGVSYEQYLRKALFEPAGMTSTGYVLPDWSQRVVAVGYDGDDTWGRPHEQPWDTDGPWWHLRANGGILSTGVDILKWHEALVGDDILDNAAKEKLFARHVAEGAEGGPWYYGYGWVNVSLPDGTTLITHNGGNGIFFADLLRFIDHDLTVLVATNAAGADEDVGFRIADALLGSELAAPVGAECVPDDPTAFPAIDEFPANEAGDTVRAMLAAVTTADDAERRAFAAGHIPSYLARGMTPEQLSSEIALLQEEFAPYTLDAIHQADEFTFYVILAGTDETGEAVITTVLNPDVPSEIACVDFGFGY